MGKWEILFGGVLGGLRRAPSLYVLDGEGLPSGCPQAARYLGHGNEHIVADAFSGDADERLRDIVDQGMLLVARKRTGEMLDLD